MAIDQVRLVTHRVTDPASHRVRELNVGLDGLHAHLLKTVIDSLDGAIPSDRQFAVLKRQVMDAFGQVGRTRKAMVARMLAEESNGTTDTAHGAGELRAVGAGGSDTAGGS